MKRHTLPICFALFLVLAVESIPTHSAAADAADAGTLRMAQFGEGGLYKKKKQRELEIRQYASQCSGKKLSAKASACRVAYGESKGQCRKELRKLRQACAKKLMENQNKYKSLFDDDEEEVPEEDLEDSVQ